MARKRNDKGQFVKVKDRPRPELNPNDPTSIEGKDPSKIYRFASRERGKIVRAELKGYEVVSREEAEKQGLRAPFLDHNQSDNTVGNRELVLMQADRRRVEARQRKQTETNLRREKREHERAVEEALSDGLLTEREATEMLRDGFTRGPVD